MWTGRVTIAKTSEHFCLCPTRDRRRMSEKPATHCIWEATSPAVVEPCLLLSCVEKPFSAGSRAVQRLDPQ